MKVPQPVKRHVPVLRGKIHIPVLLLSPVLGVFLKYKCNFPFKLAYYISIICSLFNFIVTLVLHNVYWTQVSRSLLRRIDYAGIFLMIGGSGFPCSVHYMDNDSTVWLVLAHWAVIFFGVFGSLLFNFTCTPKWFRSIVYVLSSIPYFYHLYLAIGSKFYLEVSLMLSTGFFYTAGSVFYAAQSPNLIPGIFESHELFHLCCIFGFLSSSSVNFLYWRMNKI